MIIHKRPTILVLFGVLLCAACSTPGSGGDAPPRTRGMRLPPAGQGPDQAAGRQPMSPTDPVARPAPVVPRKLTPTQRLHGVLENNPKDHTTRLKLAQLLLQGGEVGAAEKHLRELLRAPSHKQPAQVLLVRLLRAVFRLEEAIKLGKAAVAEHPKDVEAHKQLALALFANRARALAAEQLETALKLAPGRADLWRLLGDAYLKWRKHTKAAAALERAVKLDPRNPWPHVLLGDVYWGQSRVRAATRLYRKAANLTGGPPVFRAVALDKLGTLLAQRGKRRQATRVLDACRKAFPHLGCPYTHAALLPANPVKVPGAAPVRKY